MSAAFRRKSINRGAGGDDGGNIPNPTGGVRTMSRYGKKKTLEDDDSDDDDDTNTLSAYDGFDGMEDSTITAITSTVKFDDSDAFRNISVNVELKRLPPINKDRDKTKRENNFVAKLEQCCVVFDFRPFAKVENPRVYATSKQVKKNALTELISYVMNNKDVLNERTLSSVINTLEKNLFRSFATAANPHSAPFDPEDDEPILEPAWPHLHLVYTLFLRCLESKSLNSELYAKVVSNAFIRQFMELCGSCDPRERNLAKSCIHKMYGRFMPIRGPIRQYMADIFIRHSNSNEQFHGIAEILEFYGCIVSGFAAPIKEEHQRMLLDALMPLHRPKSISGYHRQLVHCVSQFLVKDTSLAPKVLSYLYRYWPKNNSPKQVLFLNELQSLSQALGLSFPDFLSDFCKKIAGCSESVHFMVAERALAYFHLQSFVRLVHKHSDITYPILVPAIHRNCKRHWSGAIHDHNEHAMEVLQVGNADLFEQYTTMEVNAHDEDFDLERFEVEKRWDALFAMAKANPISAEVEVVKGVPSAPARVPDIFMKGETTSPKRQNRMHKRMSLVLLEPLRNKDDVEAMQHDTEDAQTEFDDDEDDDDDGTTVPVPTSKLLIRQKSTLKIPGHDDIERALSDFKPEQLDEDIPKSPRGHDAVAMEDADPIEVAATEDFVEPVVPVSASEIDQVDNDEWVPLDVEPACTDGCWMVKRKSGMFKRSRRRWFAIEIDRSRIAYYVDSPHNLKNGESLGDARGIVDFSQIMEVNKAGRQLFLTTKQRKFALTSDSSFITDQWAATLGVALESHEQTDNVFQEEDQKSKTLIKGVEDDDGLPTRGNTIRKGSTGSDFFGFDSPSPSLSPTRRLSDTGDTDDEDDLVSPQLSRQNSLSGLKKALDVDAEAEGRLVHTGDALSDWFAKDMGKKECDGIVAKSGDGDFLVRNHKSGDKLVVCVNDNGTAANYSIKRVPDGFKYGGEFRKTLEEVIDLMRVQPPINKEGRKLWLMSAAEYDNGTKSTISPTPTGSPTKKTKADSTSSATTSTPPAQPTPTTAKQGNNHESQDGEIAKKTGHGIRGRNGSFYGFEDDDMEELEA
eukprot:m.217687 g.217687  ORF g.217687 m.217687 type:complete len:1079 (+) comp33242_c2_seq1:381-3617(+)